MLAEIKELGTTEGLSKAFEQSLKNKFRTVGERGQEMNYTEQRELAAKLFPYAAKEILDRDNCFEQILPLIRREDALAMTDMPAEWAYHWAYCIGDLDHMRPFVTDPKWAYWWALSICDLDHMRPFVTDPEWAYHWALYIGDLEHMRQFVTEPKWAYAWACRIGDRDHMRQFVTDPKWAYKWALHIGDLEGKRC